MKSKLALVVLVSVILKSNLSPANAIFGFSQCEKLDKQIKLDLMTGDILWQRYKLVDDPINSFST